MTNAYLWRNPVVDEAAARRIAETGKLPLPVARALARRGLTTPAAAADFLAPGIQQLADPFALPDMAAAVERLRRALAARETILIHGDYDVDGISSAALLTRVLRALGGTVDAYLPDRAGDGYGFHAATVERLLARRPTGLIVTVDCGTGAMEAVAAARARGADVIVSDHHEPGEAVAPALAVVNPKRRADDPARPLAGVGVAFKLAHALATALRADGDPAATAMNLRDYLDLAALGTVADVVPLTGENRVLVHDGLLQLAKTRWAGLRALAEVAGLSGAFSAWHLGYVLGPRLNAAGRMGRPDGALELLLTDDSGVARARAEELNAANAARQQVEAEVVNAARTQLEKTFDPARDFGLVAAGAGWPAGVIGIVAARLTRSFQRPVVVVALDETGAGRGSGRSPESFHLLDGLRDCADVLGRYGGHALAAGLDLPAGNLNAFRERFNAAAARRLRGQDLRPTLDIEDWLAPGQADEALHDAMDRLRPFGQDNPAPIWGWRRARHAAEPRKLKDRHWKFRVSDGPRDWDAIAFNQGDRPPPEGDFALAFELGKNTWQGRESLQLQVRDFRPAEDGC